MKKKKKQHSMNYREMAEDQADKGAEPRTRKTHSKQHKKKQNVPQQLLQLNFHAEVYYTI